MIMDINLQRLTVLINTMFRFGNGQVIGTKISIITHKVKRCSISSCLGRVAEETDCRGEKEFEEGDKAYATVVGSIEQFDGNYDAKAQI
jgi:hypothetical protein